MSSGAEESDSGLEGYSDSEVDEAVNLGGSAVAVASPLGSAEQGLGTEEGVETSEVRGELQRLGLDCYWPYVRVVVPVVGDTDDIMMEFHCRLLCLARPAEQYVLHMKSMGCVETSSREILRLRG